MNCIEKELEAKLISVFVALAVPGLEVIGVWNVSEKETAGTRARLAVKVSPRGYDRYTVSKATFAVTVELSVRVDVDPRGELLADCAAAVSDLLHRWNMNHFNEAKTALSIPGEMSVGGIKVSAGDGPDREGDVWYVTYPVEIVGFVELPQNNNNQGE